ncbi:C4-dicarboxylate ABC transporter [Kaistia sp. 32K]|nr:C4-dicarboxylate ABC transporter [Kaistia sp. 32K]
MFGVGVAGLGSSLAIPSLAMSSLATPSIARAADRLVWKMATVWPKDTPGVGISAQRLVERIATLSDGRLTVQLFAAGELVAPSQVFDAVSNGKAEMGHGSPFFWAAKDPAFHYFSGVPFGLTVNEHAAWLGAAGGQALWERAYEPFGVLPFYAGSTGPQAAGWFKREIQKPEDFKGLAIRITGLGAEVLKRLGANPVLLPQDDIAAALESGTIDAAEWAGPWNDLALNLPRAAPFCYMPAFHELATSLELTVNKAAFETLPNDLQTVVRTAAQAAAIETSADFTANNILALPMLIERGTAVKSFPEPVIAALAKTSADVLTEIGDASPMAKEVHPAFIAFRKKAVAYAAVADGAALAMRARALAT